MRFIAFLSTVSVLSASTWTVCKSGSGCNYTTINGAAQDFTNVHCGDTIQIRAGLGGGTGGNGTPSGWYCGGSGICNANNPVVLTQNCPATNPITITTDQTAKLPQANVRITPAYADGASPVVPTIYNPGPGLLLYAAPGNGGAPGAGYVIRGLQFCCSSSYSDFIPLGSRGQGTLDSQLNVTSDIPNNITLDRVLVRTDPTENTRKCITYDALALYIWNSWVDCAFDETASDAEAINGLMGQGSILNNFLSGATETLSLGGAMPPVLTPIVGGVKSDSWEILSTQIPGPLEVGWNEITKPRWIYAFTNWAPSVLYPKGQILHDSLGDSTPVMKAQNTCTSGAAQPTWPSSVGGTVIDGTCTWKRTDTVDQAKNLFECKTCNGVYIHDNFMHRSWPQGQQGYAFTLTSSQTYSTQQRVLNVTIANNYLRDVGSGVNTQGQDTSQDLNAIPTIMTGVGPWNITSSNNKLSIIIDGTTVPVTLTTGGAQSAGNVQADLTAAFTTAGVGLACLDNLGAVVIRGRKSGDASSCSALAVGQNLGSSYYVQINSTTNDAWPTLVASVTPGSTAASENTAYTGCISPRTLAWYGCGRFNGLLVQNNLFANMNSTTYFTGIPYLFAVFQHEENIQYTHNTADATYGYSNSTFGANLINGWLTNLESFASGFPPYNVLVRDNVIGWKGPSFNPSGGVVGFMVQSGIEYDFSVINYMFCQPVFLDSLTATATDSTCPAGIVSHNLLAGAKLYSAPTRNTVPFTSNLGYNSYPSDNYNSTSFTLDPVTYRWTNPSGPATDFATPGVDSSQIPRIVNPQIRVSDRAAIVSYSLTEPVAKSGYACIAYVTTKDSYSYNQPAGYDAADSSPVVADMDPSQFTQPDWDGNDKFPQAGVARTIVIGLNSPLASSAIYYLRLECPGASWPENGTSANFTTNAVESGTETLAIARTPAAAVGAVASMRVTYGSGYSRAAGTISGGGTSTASCSGGSRCAASVTAARGTPLYIEVQYLDGSSNVLYSEPVTVAMP